jgi:WD40 repeat protein
MPRVVCQVRARPGRVTFVWSAGKSSFEPYHLDGPEIGEALRQLKREAAEILSSHPAEDAPAEDAARAGRALAEVGHRLFRHIFPSEPGGTAAEVLGWLTRLQEQGAVESLEILGDHDSLPWNIVCDRPPADSALGGGAESGTAWQDFWGVRYNLAGGRRCGPLRPAGFLEQPVVLLAIDPGAAAALGPRQRQRLHGLLDEKKLEVVESVGDLARALRAGTPDVLYLFGRAAADGLALGGAPLTPADLEDLLRSDNTSDLPWNSRLVFVNACRLEGAGPWEAAGPWHALGLGGLILPDEPPPADFANAFGLDLLSAFLYQGQAIGPLAQALRQRTAPLGLVYHTCCPPWLRVTWQEAEEAEAGAAAAASEMEAEVSPLPDEPYRPLIPYDREDRALFVGRDNDTSLVADLLDAPRSRLVLVHGRAGVGKSSLLRAGVLPCLEEEGVGYRALRDRGGDDGEPVEAELPVISVRATNDLPGQLALALAAACGGTYGFTTPTGRAVAVDLPDILRKALGADARPAASTAIQAGKAPEVVQPPAKDNAAGPGPGAVDEDALRVALVADPALFGRLLTALTDSLPHEPVLLIEQGEEVFTLAREREDADNRQAALEMLRRAAGAAGAGKVAVLLRTEYYGRLVSQLRRNLLDAGAVRDYLVTELDEASMTEAVVRPTLDEPVPYCSEVPFRKYGFRYEEGLPESIVRRVRETARQRQESPLALLQVVCARLAERGPGLPGQTVREADVRAAGVEKGLAGYVETLIQAVARSGRERQAVWELLGRLCRVQPDGTVTRDLVPVDELAPYWRGPTPLDAVIERGSAEGVGLFEVEWLRGGDQEKRCVSLANDAVAAVAAHRSREETIRREHGRKVTADWLWVVVPLCLLLAVIAWFWYSYQFRYFPAAKAEAEKAELTVKAAAQRLRTYERALDLNRWFIYLADLGKAEQAWRQGNGLRLRQLLLNHRKNPRPPDDFRGFEWYHFWQLTDRSRATLVGHEGAVTAVALSADGKVLASASHDGTVRLWNVDQPGQRGVLPLDAGPLNAVAFSKDGKLAFGGDDGMVRVLDLKQAELGKAVKTVSLKGHTGPVLDVVFSPAGKAVASSGADRTVRLWDLAGKPLHTLKGHTSPVPALAFSPEGTLLASGGEDRTVIVWDPAAGEKKRALAGHAGPVAALAFSADGKLLAAGGPRKEGSRDAGEVKLWDAGSGKETSAALKCPAAVAALAFAAGGKSLLTGDKENAIRLWDVAGGRELDVFRGHLGWVDALAVTRDGKTVASGAFDGAVKLWSPEVPGARQVLTGHKGAALALALSPDNKVLASGGEDGTIRLWDAATGKQVRVLKGDQGQVVSVSLARLDGKLILASAHVSTPTEEGKGGAALLLWDADKGKVLHTLKGHQGAVTGVALAPDGALLASGGADKTVVVWDVRKGAVRRKFTGHPAEVRCVTFSPTGRLVASGDAGGGIRLWDPQAGEGEEHAGRAFAERHGGPVTALAFTPDEHTLVSGSYDQTMKIWVVDGEKLFHTLEGNGGPVLSLALGPRAEGFKMGKEILSIPEAIASGGPEQGVRLWDGGRGEPTFTFAAPAGPVRGVVLSSDRRLLAAAGGDGTVRIWRAAPEEPPAPPAAEAEEGQ